MKMKSMIPRTMTGFAQRQGILSKKVGAAQLPPPDRRLREFGRSDPAEHRQRIKDRDDQASPQRRPHEGEPGEEDEGAAQQGDKETVAAGGIEAQDAAARAAAGRKILPHGHADETEED